MTIYHIIFRLIFHQHLRWKDAPFGRSGVGPNTGAALPIPAAMLQAAANSSRAAALSSRHQTGAVSQQVLGVIKPSSYMLR